MLMCACGRASVVEKHSISQIAELGAQGVPTTVLKFWQLFSKSHRGPTGEHHYEGASVTSDTHSHLSGSRSGRKGTSDAGSRGGKRDGSRSPSAQSNASNTSSKGNGAKDPISKDKKTLRFEPRGSIRAINDAGKHAQLSPNQPEVLAVEDEVSAMEDAATPDK